MSSAGRTARAALGITLIISLGLSISSCAPGLGWTGSAGREVVRTTIALGTIISIRAYGPQAENAVDAAIDRVRELEALMSVSIPGSDVARINESAGVEPVVVSPETFEVLSRALAYAQLTGGKFDPTVEPLVEAWGIGTENTGVPSADEIRRRRQLVDYRRVLVDPASRVVFLDQKGMGIDLGGIAKGYAADEAVRVLKERGVSQAIVDLGGNVAAMGTRPGGKKWRVGIQDPRGQRMDKVAVVEVSETSVVTSGDYERYFTRDGVRYHHIIDPETGHPAWTGIMSATVVAPSSLDADALSTSIFLLGPEQGMSLAESVPGVECLIITESREILLSRGLAGRVDITDRGYSVRTR